MRDHEILEQRGQTTIFDFDIEPTPEKEVFKEPAFKVGSEVKIIPLDQILDKESADYYKYYFPHVLGRRGVVAAMKKTYCTVKFGHDYVYCYFDELEVVG